MLQYDELRLTLTGVKAGIDDLAAGLGLDKLQEKICIGQGYRGKSGKLGVGNCTAKFEFCVKGCPPTEQEIYERLKEYIGNK